MAAAIVKSEKTVRPACRLIGLRYREADRVDGSFSHKWGEWFQKGLFAPLEQIALPAGADGFFDGSYIGAMRALERDFEYWIGMFLPPDSPVPAGYRYTDLPEEPCALLWLRGREDGGEIYGMEAMRLCDAELARRGWRQRDSGWFFERYNCPRFTTPDAEGNVILDYGIPLEGEDGSR